LGEQPVDIFAGFIFRGGHSVVAVQGYNALNQCGAVQNVTGQHRFKVQDSMFYVAEMKPTRLMRSSGPTVFFYVAALRTGAQFKSLRSRTAGGKLL
jgi:hypothetical protein